MTQYDADDLLAALTVIAERAGKEILAYYVEATEGGGVEVREKADASPVTDADEAAETFILQALETLTPEIPVVSEEAMAAGARPDISGGLFWERRTGGGCPAQLYVRTPFLKSSVA